MPTRADLEKFIAEGGEPDGYFWPQPEWCPAFWTQMKTKRTMGDDIADFIEKYFPPKNVRSEIVEQGFKIQPWQRFKLRNQFELNEKGFWRYREFYTSMAKQNGKTFIEAGIQQYLLVKSGNVQNYRAFNFASSRKQAKEIFDHCSSTSLANPVFNEILKVSKDRTIENTITGGSLVPLSNNFKAAQGASPVYVSADEIWSMFNLTGSDDSWELLYEGLVQSSANRDESMVSMATTAGTNLGAFAYNKYSYGKEIAHGLKENETFGAMVWEADDDGDISDKQQWFYANPNLATGIMALSDFEAAYRKAEAFGSYHFEVFRLNKWLRNGKNEGFIIESFLEEWKKEGQNIQPGEPIVIGFDGSQVRDTTAIVAISLKTGFIKLLKIWEPLKNETNYRVPVKEVEKEIDFIFKTYRVMGLYGDPSYYRDSFEKWIKKYGKQAFVRDEPPTISRFQPYSQKFREALYEGKLSWNQDKVKEHFLNAVTNWREMPIRENRHDNKFKDALDAAIYAYAAAEEYVVKRERRVKQYGLQTAKQQFGYDFELPSNW